MTISQIFDSYDIKRNIAESRAEENHNRIRKNSPEYARLEDRRRELYADLLGATLTNSKEKETIKKEIAEISEDLKEILVRSNLDINPSYECKICNDTGYVEKNGEKSFCVCILEKIYSEVFGAKVIGELKGSFGTFDDKMFSEERILFAGKETSPREQIRLIRDYAERYVRAFPALVKQNMLLIGGAGLGKTFLMECIARRLYIKTRKIFFIDSFELFSVFHKHRLGELSDSLDLIYDADIVLIDDLGTEPMTQNVTKEYFLRLLEIRGGAGKPIIAATNMSESQLTARYGERICSRLLSDKNCKKLYFAGEDLRF